MALFSDLADNGLMSELTTLAKGYYDKPVTVHLDGFNLIGGNPTVRPYTWFLPKPSVNITEMLRIYESAACQPLSQLESVAEICSHIYPRNSDERRMIAKMAANDNWLSPVLLLAAASQYLGAEVETAGLNRASLRLGNGLIQVGPEGCWSNLRRETVPAAYVDGYVTGPATDFPSINTNNPVIAALHELCDESDIRYAVTVLALALEEEIVNKSLLNKIAKLEHPIAKKAKAKKRNVEDAARALTACEAILDHGVYDIIPELYDAAVPNLLPYRKLYRIVGSPTRGREGRQIREETLNNWRVKLQNEFEEIVNART